MERDDSDAHEIGTADLLRSAARLVERTLIKLDMVEANCPTCEARLFRNREHARIYEQISDTPDKLRRLADRIDESSTTVGHQKATSVGFLAAIRAALAAGEKR